MANSQDKRRFPEDSEDLFSKDSEEQLYRDLILKKEKENKKHIIERIFAHPFEQKTVLATVRQLLIQTAIVVFILSGWGFLLLFALFGKIAGCG